MQTLAIVRELEMPLINYKVHLELNWITNYLMSTDAGDTPLK